MLEVLSDTTVCFPSKFTLLKAQPQLLNNIKLNKGFSNMIAASANADEH